MARRTITIDEKIERQKAVVSKHKDKYDAAVEELEKLMRQRDEIQDKEIVAAFHRGGMPYEDAIKLLNSGREKE